MNRQSKLSFSCGSKKLRRPTFEQFNAISKNRMFKSAPFIDRSSFYWVVFEEF